MATDGKHDAVEGSWSPKRPRTAAEQRASRTPRNEDAQVTAGDVDKTREERAETLDGLADKVSPKPVAKATSTKAGRTVKQSAAKAADAAASHLVEEPHIDVPSAAEPVVPAPHPLSQETVAIPVSSPGELADATPAPVTAPAGAEFASPVASFAPVGAEFASAESSVPAESSAPADGADRPAPAAPASKVPVLAAAAALAVLLLLLRRRRRR